MEEFEFENMPEFEFEPEMSFEEQSELWETIFSKISTAVSNNHNFTILFNLVPQEKGSDEGSSAVLDRSQFELLLTNYLKWCEKNELFEKCSEVQKVLHKLRGVM
jgi:hypothetical protein